MLHVPAVLNRIATVAPEVLDERLSAGNRIKVVVGPPGQGLLKQALAVVARLRYRVLAASPAVEVGLRVGRQDSAVLDIIINAQVVTDPQDYF